MRPVALHRQQVPGIAVQIGVEIADQRRRRNGADLIAVAIDEPGYGAEFGAGRLQNGEQLLHRDRSLAVASKVDGLLADRALR